MRILLTIGAALVVAVFMFDRSLDADDRKDRKTAKLEKELASALRTIDKLDQERLAGLKRERELDKKLKSLAVQFIALDKKTKKAMTKLRRELLTKMDENMLAMALAADICRRGDSAATCRRRIR
ncbi:MAG: hypothetical protein OXN89_25010 [Bryobacterales bacterium]|nr:hypothetical protein [Bryobacterales bacterium]